MEERKLKRFCELKTQQKKIEEELEELRKEIIAAYPGDVQFQLDGYTLKIIYQDKRHYDDAKLFEAVPDPELWKALFKADSSKISAFVKTSLLSEKLLEGTYKTSRTPFLYVQT
ncbi:hypothetical protein D7Z26_24145 [Cohnella endophytica]|uniref:Uncharacterized protein n=1 Tax=Cohnella endophytica TaxID=2419778 RepID=A0A494XGI9_9BACL|nr:hypothetical protein [Cohnella endophytica]RKP46703.1 hypothetical protein D7Z26_24145 [Cohnella endophytica]